VAKEQSFTTKSHIGNIEHVISERFIWKLSFIEEVLAVMCSHRVYI
jgi:hypothetical protein